MAFAEALKTFTTGLPGIPGILASMSEEDGSALLDALADKSIRHVDITRALNAEGYDISESSVRRHRERM